MFQIYFQYNITLSAIRLRLETNDAKYGEMERETAIVSPSQFAKRDTAAYFTTANGWYVPAYFRSARQSRYYYFPQGVETYTSVHTRAAHAHTAYSSWNTYVLWSLPYVSVIVGTCFTSGLYVPRRNFIFPAESAAARRKNFSAALQFSSGIKLGWENAHLSRHHDSRYHVAHMWRTASFYVHTHTHLYFIQKRIREKFDW